MTPVALREKAREYALRTVDSQREQFKRYGVWGDWAQPYVTLQHEYEAAQVGVFGEVCPPRTAQPPRVPLHPGSAICSSQAQQLDVPGAPLALPPWLVLAQKHDARSAHSLCPARATLKAALRREPCGHPRLGTGGRM